MPLSTLQEVYIDETSQNGKRFLVIGGIVFPKSISRQFEADIINARLPRLEVRFDRDMKLTEIGWHCISKGDFAAYKKVVDAYFSFARRRMPKSSATIKFYCSVIDTHVRGRRYSGKDGQIGFNREIYFHCMTIARRQSADTFDVYPDERSTNMTMEKMRTILNRGIRKEFRGRWPFKRVQFRESHKVQALQVSDILIGAVAYRLNRHYDEPGGDDKTRLCEYILQRAKFWDRFRDNRFKPKPFGQSELLFRRHLPNGSRRPTPR